MIAQKLDDDEELYEIRIKHNTLISVLKNIQDEDKYKLNGWPDIMEYDHEVHSEMALSSLKVVYGENKP